MAMLKITDADRVREDVGDDILMLDDGKECPLTDRIGRGDHPGNASLFEWPLEKYSNDTSLGAVSDAAPVAAADLQNNAANRGMLQGRSVMQRHAIGVGTKVQRGTNKPGIPVGKGYDHELAIGMVELKRKTERALIGVQNSAAEGGSPGMTRGIISCLRTANPATANDLPQSYLLPAAQVVQKNVADIVIGDLNAAMQSIWTNSGRRGIKYNAYCSGPMKTRVTEFMTDVSVAAGKYFPVSYNGKISDHEIELVVDVVTGDWGTVEFEPHSFIPANHHFIALDLQRFKIRPCFGMEHQKLPVDGSGERGFVETFWGLEFNDPTAHFRSCTAAAQTALNA